MPIPNSVLTAAQFEYLANNIVQQVDVVSTTGAVALSGLDYIVNLDTEGVALAAQPEVDLVNPFYDQMSRMDAFGSTYSNWTAVATALNLHGINRGAPLTSYSGTLSSRLNQYFENEGISVPYIYSEISAACGFTISYLYTNTTIASVTPATGSHLTTTSVTIVGENFVNGGSPSLSTAVSFGANPATNVVIVSGTELTCTAPTAAGGGAVTVTVTNPAGLVLSAALVNGFLYT